MIHFNSYNISLSGTNFGLLSGLPTVNYLDSYLLTDLFGNTTINYTNTSFSNSFFEPTNSTSISSISGIILWVDSQDSNNVITENNAISALVDKSTSNHVFLSAGSVTQIVTWPITGTKYSNKNCILFDKNSLFFNDRTFNLNLTGDFSIYLVWKDNNTSFGNTIPFGLYTTSNFLTSELILKNNYYSEKQGEWGVRFYDGGFRVENFNGLLSSENITLWEYVDSGVIAASSNTIFVDNSSVPVLSGIYFIDKDFILSGSGIGYYGDNNNKFLFGEMIVFDRKLSNFEKTFVYNYFSDKWNFNLYRDNLIFSNELTGGPLSNFSYEDYSLLTSIVTIPIQSCVTMLTIDLSNFDVSKSKINKVVYSINDKETTLTSKIVDNTLIFDDVKFSFIVVPSNNKTIETYYMYLSVFRHDSTINKLIVSGDLIKCGIRDFYKNSKLLDSQIGDDSKEVLLVSENTDDNAVFLNKLNIGIPAQSLSGGEVEPLINSDYIEDEDIIFLLDLISDEVVTEKFSKPFFVPVPAPRTNPIRPT